MKLRRGAICLAFAYAGLFPLQLDLLFMGGESRYAAEQWMQEHFKKEAIVETFAAHHHHLGWYYPRFPDWVRVRSSKLEAGTQWIPYKAPPDRRRFPNLYEGREAPDYIVLKFFDEEANVDQKPVLAALFHGRLGYSLVATFKTLTIVPVNLTMNPRIYIFERTENSPTTQRSSSALPAHPGLGFPQQRQFLLARAW